MASSSSSISSSLFLAAIAVVLLLSITAAHAKLLHTVGHVLRPNACKKASHPDLCEQVAKAGDIDSMMDLEIAIIKQTIEKVKDAVDEASHAIKSAGDDKERKKHLESCKKYYKDAIDDLKAGLDFLKGTGSDFEVNMSLSSALTDIDSCSTEWANSGFKDFPLGPTSALLIKMISNSISVGNGLKSVDTLAKTKAGT